MKYFVGDDKGVHMIHGIKVPNHKSCDHGNSFVAKIIVPSAFEWQTTGLIVDWETIRVGEAL